MGALGRMVLLKDIWLMLRKCAPGSTHEVTDHYYCVKYKGRTYPSLPKGKHGQPIRGQRRSQAEIEIGYVRHMIRQLEITNDDCIKRYIQLE